MRTPSKDSIVASKGRYHIVRKTSYNGRTTEQVLWQVCEQLIPKAEYGQTTELWRLEREFDRKKDALTWFNII